MGAAVITLATTDVMGNKRVHIGTATLSSSYATGGDTWTENDFGMLAVDQLQLETAGGTIFEPDLTNKKIKALRSGDAAQSVLVEVANGDDLSGITFRFTATGT